MKRLWLILFVLSFANSQNTIAVLDFKSNGISISEASSISEKLRTELFNNSDYRVVERDKLEAILEEKGLMQSGIVSDENIVNVGGLIGVDRIVVGTINKIGKLYSLSARIVKVETGEILESVSYEHSGNLSYLLKTGMRNVAFELLGQEQQEILTLAIIPLKNKGKEEDAFYAYGISADLISDISSSGLIRVSSQQDIENIYTKSLSNDELAEKLNAQIGSSRPVVDAGWLDHSRQIGSSGQTVSPKLYFSIGISGAIQHLVGMKGSKNIIAINKDPNAPIFEIADYAVIGDIFEILPKLTEQL